MSFLLEISGAYVFYFVVKVATRLVVAFEDRVKNDLHDFPILINNLLLHHLFNRFHREIFIKTIP